MKHIIVIGLFFIISLPAISDTPKSDAYQFWLQPSLGIQSGGVGKSLKARYIQSDKIYALEVRRGSGLFNDDESRQVSLTAGKLWENGLLTFTAEAGIAYVDLTEGPNESSLLPASSQNRQQLDRHSGVGIPLVLGVYINSPYVGIGLSTGAILTQEGTIGMFEITVPFGKLKY